MSTGAGSTGTPKRNKGLKVNKKIRLEFVAELIIFTGLMMEPLEHILVSGIVGGQVRIAALPLAKQRSDDIFFSVYGQLIRDLQFEFLHFLTG